MLTITNIRVSELSKGRGPDRRRCRSQHIADRLNLLALNSTSRPRAPLGWPRFGRRGVPSSSIVRAYRESDRRHRPADRGHPGRTRYSVTAIKDSSARSRLSGDPSTIAAAVESRCGDAGKSRATVQQPLWPRRRSAPPSPTSGGANGRSASDAVLSPAQSCPIYSNRLKPSTSANPELGARGLTFRPSPARPFTSDVAPPAGRPSAPPLLMLQPKRPRNHSPRVCAESPSGRPSPYRPFAILDQRISDRALGIVMWISWAAFRPRWPVKWFARSQARCSARARSWQSAVRANSEAHQFPTLSSHLSDRCPHASTLWPQYSARSAMRGRDRSSRSVAVHQNGVDFQEL